jgi:acetyltransferase
MCAHPLRPLFEPNSIAVLGTGPAGTIGERVFRNLSERGYGGSLYAVDPQRQNIAAARVYPALSALPERVELVVVAVAAGEVPAALRQCGEHGAKIAMVVSDLADSGEDTRHLLAEAHAVLRQFPLRMVGPNALGVMRSKLQLNASFSHGIGRPGSLAFVSQSAALCSAILDWADLHNVGFSTIASLGTATDVGVGEVLDYLAIDRETRAVLLYVEGVDRARTFMSGLRALARVKPVIVVKAGRRTPADASIAHVGTITGQDEVFDAALRRAGAVRVASLAQLFSTAELFAHAPRVAGENLAIVTNAAALGVLAVDRIDQLGLQLASLSQDTVSGLAGMVPRHACVGNPNPIDVRHDATPERYAQALKLCLADPGVNAVLVLLSPQLLTDPRGVASAIAEAEHTSRTPVLACFMGGVQVDAARALLAASEVPSFDSPEAAVEAFSYLASHRRTQELLMQAPDAFVSDAFDIDGARLIIEAALAQGRTTLSQLESKAVLRAFSIPVSPAVAARSADEALVAAQQLGFPVALKIDSPDIVHKTEVNGVRLNVANAGRVRTVYRELTEEVARLKPEARILGVIVEPMFERESGRELIAGVVRDRAFGPAIAVGAGGTWVEVLGRPSIGLPPLNTRLAREMLARSNAARMLGKIRHWPEANHDAIVKVLLRLSDLACELPEVQELDINPLVADPSGVVALDARVTIRTIPASQGKYAHLALAPYPRQLIQHLQLADGTSITVRPIRPEDTQLEQDFVRDLSLESRRFRFLGALSRLSSELMIRFTQLDYDRELALIAVTHVDGRDVEVGVARYIGDSDGVGCEFAIVVADAWQKRGLASLLMRALIGAAREHGFTRMHGDVLADNSRMLSWMSRLGFEITTHPDDATLRLVTLALR